jgi:CRP/FNR family transcriptional regulator, cyclic AMP receptor protein
MEITAENLKRFSIFATVPAEKLQKIIPIVKVAKYAHKQKIFEEGSEGDRLFLVSEGTVRISKFIEGVGEEAMSMLEQGTYFGEMSIIDMRPRSAAAIANADSEIWEIGREDFIDLLQSDRDIAFHVLWNLLKTLSQRLRDTNEKIKAFFAMTSGF